MASNGNSPTDLVRGHTPVLPPKWVRNVPRIEDGILESFRNFSVPDISDAVGALYTMSPGMGALYEPIDRLVGRALTVKAPPGDSLTVHGAITLCQPGDVLVIDWRGHVDSCSGGSGMLMGPIRQGLAGIVVDGAWRDIADLQALNFPVFGRGTCPVSRAKSQLGEINVPVSCGGVVVHPGDLIVADAEGIVVVPRAETESVLSAVRERSKKADAARGQDAPAPEAAPADQASALADHLEQRARAHYGDKQGNVSRAAIFADVFAAAGGVPMDWVES
jgi:4-hydroxy-4-methyl-2-oxoglutarate aldolase